MLKFIFLGGLLFISTLTFAHVGSPGVIYQGKAGPYTIMVNINPPDVIPGTATASVYIDNQLVSHVYMQPVYWSVGDKGSPKADEAFLVKGTPGQYQGVIWLMQSGIASIRITIDGPLGKGSTIIPVMANSTAQRTMPASLDWLLAGLGFLLVIFMVTTIGASVTDGMQEPGADQQYSTNKKYWAMAVATVVLLMILYGGSYWWNSWANRYSRFMYKSPLTHSSVLMNGSQMVLHLNIDTAWTRKNQRYMSFLVPDHGKLMHLFLIKQGTDDVFAHLHPSRIDSVDYEVKLPDLPEGSYLVFGDVVRWSGFTETFKDTVFIPKKFEKPITPKMLYTNSGTLFRDPDDTYIITNSVNDNKNPLTGKISIVCGKPGTEMKLSDGSTATWQHVANTPFEANQIYPLTFLIKDPSGKPAKLQPYMGMTGHAVVMKYDGSVYVHLHPVGTYSMASQDIIQSRINSNGKIPSLPDAKHFRDSIDQVITKIRAMTEDERNAYLNVGMKDMKGMAMPGMSNDGLVAFPYAFPSPGNYRIWVQTKRDGKILNSAFDAVVQ
jgi:hypothetical protein